MGTRKGQPCKRTSRDSSTSRKSVKLVALETPIQYVFNTNQGGRAVSSMNGLYNQSIVQMLAKAQLGGIRVRPLVHRVPSIVIMAFVGSLERPLAGETGEAHSFDSICRVANSKQALLGWTLYAML
jgi:hypothetical protein